MSRDDPWMARHTRASADTLKGGGVLHLSRDDPWMARHTRASADTLKGGGGYCTCPGMIHGWPDILGHPRIL